MVYGGMYMLFWLLAEQRQSLPAAGELSGHLSSVLAFCWESIGVKTPCKDTSLPSYIFYGIAYSWRTSNSVTDLQDCEINKRRLGVTGGRVLCHSSFRCIPIEGESLLLRLLVSFGRVSYTRLVYYVYSPQVNTRREP